MKVAWVTGAASGIGAATARRLAADGARVACLDVEERGLAAVVADIDRAGGSAHAAAVDVADWDALAAAADGLERRLGPVEVVAAAAGITHEPAEVAALDQATWQRVLAVNLTGVFLTAKAAIPQLRRRGRGAIVIVASVGAVRGTPGYAGYIASKHGVLGLMRSLAAELAPDGIRVNAVCPGSVDTPMLRAQADRLGEEATRRWREGHLLQRLVTADEVAAAVAWLAGEESRMTTGVALPVDGGYLERAP